MMRQSLSKWVPWLGLLSGPLLAAGVYWGLPTVYTDASGEAVSLSAAGRASAAVGAWMAAWWLTEAVELPVTALLPVALFPILGALPLREAAAPYAHPLIFLFMGGFMISLAMQRWGLHRRFAVMTVQAVGTQPRRIVGGFMLAAATLSMWISNTATTLMMLPIAQSVLDAFTASPGPGHSTAEVQSKTSRLAVCLMLGVAYGASIGGVGTVIGSPPNGVVVAYIDQSFGQEIGFAQWLAIGLPLVVVFLPLAWQLLTRVLYPVPSERLGIDLTEIAQSGPMNRGEKITLVVFLGAVVAWVLRPVLTEIELAASRPLAGLSDAGVAMVAALILFVIPVDRSQRQSVMNWSTASELPWEILLLFGGGLSLARALDTNGVGAFLGSQVEALAGWPLAAVVVVTITLVILLTELTSNTATTAALVPILAALAPALGLHPYQMIFPAALAASCAFMMPVATPPNALVFASGYVTIQQMARTGLVLNLIGIGLITGLVYLVMIPLLGLGG